MFKSTFGRDGRRRGGCRVLGTGQPRRRGLPVLAPVCTGNDIPMNSACVAGGPQGTPTSSSFTSGGVQFSGGPADQLPTVSPGANPYIRLEVGN
jgi:hypothetical protein